MNYLAHLKLSQPDSHSMVGNLMGDFRKYTELDDLPVGIRDGIDNHLRVDRFTDSHAIIQELKTCFSSKRRRFAGLIIDVSFDHYLARHWNKYCDQSLDEFCSRTYQKLDDGREYMPDKMEYVVDLMTRYDWLGSYKHINVLEKTIDRMSERIRFENNLMGGIEEVENNYDTLEQGFLEFYPLLESHINI
jgi:acyl carrier protein phosphodiesterase